MHSITYEMHWDRFGLVTPGARKAIERVKEAGDNAVHVVPGSEPGPNDLLSDLVVSLSAIESIPRAG